MPDLPSIAWPSDVNQYVLYDGWAEEPAMNIAVFQTEIGPPLENRASSIPHDTVAWQSDMTNAEFMAFKSWWRYTLKDGVLEFTRNHPWTGYENAILRQLRYRVVAAFPTFLRVALAARIISEGADEDFTPLTEFGSDLVVWYKADAGVYNDAGVTLATNGQTVRQWNDQSGNARHISNSISGQRPVYNTTVFRGHPGIVFDKPTLQFLISSVDSVPLNQAAVSFFIVAKPTDASFGHIAGITNSGTATAITPELVLYWNSTEWGAFSSVELGDGGNRVADALNSYRSFGVVLNGTWANKYLNGAPQGEATAFSSLIGHAGGNTIVLAADDGGDVSRYWDGVIAEVVIVKAAINGLQRQKLQSYFADRWDI